jgi:hypothetical protein
MDLRRLVNHDPPEGRQTPLLLLADLREIDPTAELLYAGESRWWLGAVNDNDERRRRAENILAFYDTIDPVKWNMRTLMLAKVNIQGFALIEAYFGTDPAGTVVCNPGPDEYHTTILDDFRWRDAEFRMDGGTSAVQRRLLDTLREPERIEAEAKMKDYLANDGRDHYRRNMRGRVSMGWGGSTGGDKALIITP